MQPRHFIDMNDIPPETLRAILKNAHEMKKEKFEPKQILSCLSLAMVFDKRSTRTRFSFDLAMKQLGGHTIVLDAKDLQMSDAESLEDTANVISRYVDVAMFRISSHETLLELAAHSKIPVINALTDHSHPCQIMADMMTIEEKLGTIEGKKIAWFGDYNNVSHTFVQAASVFGYQLDLAIPEKLHPEEKTSNPQIRFQLDPNKAAENADVIVTDTWVSMGQEGGEEKLALLHPYQVNTALMQKAKPTAIFMHCMPIHRGEEVTNEVADSTQSVIYDEAENRLHVQKAILAWCLENAGVKPR